MQMQKSPSAGVESLSGLDRGKAFRLGGKTALLGQTVAKKVPPSREIVDSFRNTTVEHNSLRIKRETNSHGLPSIHKRVTGKEYIRSLMQTHPDLKDGYQSEQEKLNKLKEEVKALPDVLKPNPNPRTYNMILEQKKSRRAQHIQELAEFEQEVAKVKGASASRITSLKQGIASFLEDQDTIIDKFFRDMNDAHLAQREADVVGDMHSTLREPYYGDVTVRLNARLENVDKELDGLEEEFLGDVDGAVEGLRYTLTEIAFKLAPEVDQIVQGIRDGFKTDIEDGKAKNAEYYAGLQSQVALKAERLAKGVEEREARWRVIKHHQTIEAYRKEVLHSQYQDPEDRRLVIKELDDFVKETVEKRKAMIEELYSSAPTELSAQKVQKYQEQVAALDEKVQNGLDDFTSRLIKLKEECFGRLDALLERTKDKLLGYNADLKVASPDTQTWDELWKYLFEETVQGLHTRHTNSLSEILSFTEVRDKLSNDVAVRVGKSQLLFSQRLTKFSDDQAESNTKYELEKAKLEDENNEKLEMLAQALDEAKAQLRRAKDHGELEIRLKKCFKAVDDIEEEFRAFHQSNKTVTDKHQPFIEEVYRQLESDLMRLIGFVDESKRPELEDLYDRVAKWKAKVKTDNFIKERDEREQKELADLLEQNKDNKKFKPPKPKTVDPKKAAQEWQELFAKSYAELKRPVTEITLEGSGSKRLVQKSLKAFCVNMFQPVISDEEEQRRKEEEERKKREKEEAEAKAKEEEAKKKKGAAAPPKKDKAEEAPIEPAEDPEDVALPEVTSHNPIFLAGSGVGVPTGEQMFQSEHLLTLDWMIALETQFRDRLFSYVSKKRTSSLEEAKTEDHAFIELSLILLDERLRKYYSMKGKIQTEIFTIRGGEITLHKKKYEAEVKDCLDVLDAQTQEFNAAYKALFEAKEKHTKEVEVLITSLPSQNSLAAMQGVQNQMKDKDFKFGEHQSEKDDG